MAKAKIENIVPRRYGEKLSLQSILDKGMG
jgi:hypothetical protein